MKLNISESIKALRRSAAMTQEDVANALGVTYQAVSRWENGQSYPDIELLPSIAALFGVDLDRLFGIDDENREAHIAKYHKEAEALETYEEEVALTKRYMEAFPAEIYYKTRLLDMYCSRGKECTDQKLPEMRRLCQFVVDHAQPGEWERENALCSMICAEEDENIDNWMILLDRKSTLSSVQALLQRYDYRNEVEPYNRLIQEDIYNSFYHCFMDDFCKRDRKTYKSGRSRMEGQRVILQIIDALRDPSVDEDAWIEQRIFAYVRLAAGCVGCGENEAGYDALERCIELCLVYSHIPKGSVLTFHSPVLDELMMKTAGAIEIKSNVIGPLTRESGWEWFNDVRNEERFKQILAQATQIYEEMAAKEKCDRKRES